MDLNNLSDADRKKVMEVMEQRQEADFVNMYLELVDKCFKRCVTTFYSSALNTKETKCVDSCVDVFLKHTQRVSQRFSEQSMQPN